MSNTPTAVESDRTSDAGCHAGDRLGEKAIAIENPTEDRSVYLNALLGLFEPQPAKRPVYAYPESDLLR